MRTLEDFANAVADLATAYASVKRFAEVRRETLRVLSEDEGFVAKVKEIVNEHGFFVRNIDFHQTAAPLGEGEDRIFVVVRKCRSEEITNYNALCEAVDAFAHGGVTLWTDPPSR